MKGDTILLKNLREVQSYKSLTKSLLSNIRLEVAVFAVLTISLAIIILNPKTQELHNLLKIFFINYVTENRISLITSVVAIFIGIYSTILIVISTSKMSITELLLKSKMDTQILAIIGFGIAQNFLLVILGVFIPMQKWIFLEMYLCLLCIAMISFSKFILLLYRIFKLNVASMVRELDKEKDEQIELMTKIEDILNQIKSK